MGRVYLALTPGGRPVALKVIRPEYGDDQDFRRRFRQEVQAARRVHGIYTAQVLDADPDAASPWLVTAYVPGPSLHQAIADHGPMPAETVFLLVAGIAEALQAIHSAGIVHRDLKPANVLLAPDGPRVIDFGIARAAEETTVTRSGMRVGSPQFMAPEQVADRPVSAAADIFALGSLAVYAALGRAPFGEGSAAAILYRVVHEPPELSACPGQLRALIERCLAKQPAARPAPAEIIESCRAHTAGRMTEFAQSWLPAPVAAQMAQHAVPPATAPWADGPPTAVEPFMAVPPPPMPPPPMPPPPARPPPAQLGGRLDQGRPRVARTAKIAGLAAALTLAALASAGLLSLRGAPQSPGGRSAIAGGSSRAHGTDPRAKGGAASPSRTTSPGLDSCLFGTWTGTSEDVINHINNEPVRFTGRGATQIFTSGGSAVTSYGNGTVFSATVNGDKWTEIIRGDATMHYATQDGKLLVSDISPHGSWTLLDNGVYNNGGQLQLESGPSRYTCSGGSLRETPDNGSLVLTRRQP